MTNKDADLPKGLVEPGDYVKIFTQVQHVLAVAPYNNMDVIRFPKRWEKQTKKPRAISIIKPPSIYSRLEKFDAEEFTSYSSVSVKFSPNDNKMGHMVIGCAHIL